MVRQRMLITKRLATSLVILLVVSASAIPQNQPPGDPSFDPAIFKAPPARYRGHAMWNFNLVTLNENDVVSGIQEMTRLNYGGFFIEAGGAAATGTRRAVPERRIFPLLQSGHRGGQEARSRDDPVRRLRLSYRYGGRAD